MKRVIAPLTIILMIVGIMFATVGAASAHDAVVTGSAVCNHNTGNFDVAWNIHNDYSTSANLSNATRVASQVNGKTLAPNGQSASTLTATETVAPGAGTLVLKVHAVWPKDNFSKDSQGSVTVGGTCTKNDVKDADASVSTTPATCTTGETAVLGTAVHAAWGALTGAVGPGNYAVDATADQGHAFADGSHVKHFTGTLAGPNTDLCATCTACSMPHRDTNAPAVTVCQGILVNGVYNDILVKPGHSCTLVNGYVNGKITATHAHTLTLGSTEVRGNVVADYTQNLTVGSINTTCDADPLVGGSIFARHAHNVILCKVQVCHKVVITHATGRVLYRSSRSTRLVVTHNNVFVKDGVAHHRKLAAVRLFNDGANKFVIRDNKRPVDKRNLTHIDVIAHTPNCVIRT